MNSVTRTVLCATLFATVALSVVMAQESSDREASYKLSGEASVSSIALWSGDGSDDKVFEASDILYGSDTALTLYLDAKRHNIRASFSGRTDIMTGISAPSPAAPTTFLIKRAYLRWTPGSFVVTAGRQLINWGAAMLWSPADLFAQTVLTGLTTERQGTDAIRIAMPLGSLGGIEAVSIPGLSFSTGRYGGRLYGYALGSDIGLQAARDLARGETTIAVNIKTDLVLGVWAEASYTFLDDDELKDRFEAIFGADWSVAYRTIISAEYRYNARAVPGEDYPAIHYLFASLGTKLGDFVSLGAGGLIDIANGIVSASLTSAIDVAQDASLALLAQYSNGQFDSLRLVDAVAIGATLSLAF